MKLASAVLLVLFPAVALSVFDGINGDIGGIEAWKEEESDASQPQGKDFVPTIRSLVLSNIRRVAAACTPAC